MISRGITNFHGVLFILYYAVKPRDGVDSGILGDYFALNLVTHLGHGRDGGSNKGDTMLVESLAKFKVFRQKAIPGMNGLGTRLSNGCQDGFNV